MTRPAGAARGTAAGDDATARKARRLGRETFGFSRLRDGQEEAIVSVASGRDTLAVLPTGWGKSAIYQLAALVIPGPTVVVSPLIALQQDQVRSLLENRVAAAASNSHVPGSERDQALDDLAEGAMEFLFLAPEQLANPEVLARTAAARPSLLVVDEAHCIGDAGSAPARPFELHARVRHSEWGGGQVMAYDRDLMTVFFDEVGYKTLGVDLLAASGVLEVEG